MRRLIASIAVVAVLGVVNHSRAEDKIDPTGTWKWTSNFNVKKRKPIEVTLILKVEGTKLIGTITGPDGKESEIVGGFVGEKTISFSTKRPQADYQGEVRGDTILGAVQYGPDGKLGSAGWKPKRVSK